MGKFEVKDRSIRIDNSGGNEVRHSKIRSARRPPGVVVFEGYIYIYIYMTHASALWFHDSLQTTPKISHRLLLLLCRYCHYYVLLLLFAVVSLLLLLC